MSTPRNSLEVVRYDWFGVRIGGPGASMRGLWPVLFVAILVVFGCFFAVGRLSAGGGSPKQDSSAAPVARAAVPGELRGGTPIPAEVPSAIAEPPQRRRPAPPRSAEALHATAPFVGGGTTTTTTSAGSQTETAPAQEAVPTQASTGSSGSGTRSSSNSSSPGSSSGGGSAGTGAGAGAGSGGGGAGGGSFDSSE
ncbi:MAG: hypothetical protein ACHQHO_07550 [Solirubrobacterales bacterium]